MDKQEIGRQFGASLMPSRWGMGPQFLLLDEAADGAGSEAAPGKSFSQADVDRIVKERLEREKTAREKAAQKAREEAEAGALQKNQEWQTLGEQVTRYKGALDKYLQAEKKDLPRYVLALLEKLDPVEQIEYISANREELGKPASKAGVPPSPEPKERTLSEDEQQQARRSQAQIYQNF